MYRKIIIAILAIPMYDTDLALLYAGREFGIVELYFGGRNRIDVSPHHWVSGIGDAHIEAEVRSIDFGWLVSRSFSYLVLISLWSEIAHRWRAGGCMVIILGIVWLRFGLQFMLHSIIFERFLFSVYKYYCMTSMHNYQYQFTKYFKFIVTTQQST